MNHLSPAQQPGPGSVPSPTLRLVSSFDKEDPALPKTSARNVLVNNIRAQLKGNVPRLSQAPITDHHGIENLGHGSGFKPMTDPECISSVEKFSMHHKPPEKSNQLYDSLKHLLEHREFDSGSRQTKVICTLGKKLIEDPSGIEDLMKEGMDIARLNMDFLEIDEMEMLIKNVAKAARK